jgi:hypothetical protein
MSSNDEDEAVRREAAAAAVTVVSPRDIRWEDESPDEVEDLVAALVLDLHPGAYRVDGTGGDGGRDCVVPDAGAGGQGIVSIKSFARRLGPSQRKQIKASLKEALKHEPAWWQLIAPLELTPGERTWFNKLQATTTVPLEFKGLTWLRTELASRPAIVRMHSRTARERVLELARAYDAEKAVLAGGARDAVERMAQVQRMADQLDPDFTIQVTTSPWGEAVTVVPTKPDALDRRPITGNLNIVFDRTTPERAAECDEVIDALRYGGDVDIPEHFIQSASLNAPLGMGFDSEKDDGNVRLYLRQTEENAGWSAPGRFCVLAADGPAILETLPLVFQRRTAGNGGARLFARDHSGALTVTVTLDRVQPPALTWTATYERPDGAPPSEVLPVLRFLNALGHTQQVALYVERDRLAAGHLDDVDELAVPDGYLDFVEMLGRIEAATGVPFPMPADVSDADIANYVEVDKLLAGETITFNINDGSVTIRADAAGQIADTFETGAEGSWVIQAQGISLDIDGTIVPVGRLGTFMAVRIGTDADEAALVIAALRDTGRRHAAGEDVDDVVVPMRQVRPDACHKRLLRPDEFPEVPEPGLAVEGESGAPAA